jgi:hypothetical protein
MSETWMVVQQRDAERPTVLTGSEGEMRAIFNQLKLGWSETYLAQISDGPRDVLAASPPAPTFEDWYAQPCERCGGPRNYRVGGQYQVVCFNCATPAVPAYHAGREELYALAARLTSELEGLQRDYASAQERIADLELTLVNRNDVAARLAIEWAFTTDEVKRVLNRGDVIGNEEKARVILGAYTAAGTRP